MAGYSTKPLSARRERAALHHWVQVEHFGKTMEQVAAEEKTTVMEVQRSINYVKEWQIGNSTALLQTKFIEIAMKRMESMGKVYDRGMKAEKVIFVNQKTGRVKKAPDIPMQLKTAEAVRGILETVQPKGPALQLNQQNNFGVPSSGGFGTTMSFEAILRKKREEKGLINSQDAEIIQAELTDAETIADE